MSSSERDSVRVLAYKDHFPVCIVWTPLPILSWFVPFIGHLGISTSDGVLHDFAGSHYVRTHPHSLAFGPVCKYAPVSLGEIRTPMHSTFDTTVVWDRAVQEVDQEYGHLSHNLLCNNCHDHVANVLNRLHYKNFTHWNTVTLTIYMIYAGKFPSVRRAALVYVPFLIVVALILGFSFGTRSLSKTV